MTKDEVRQNLCYKDAAHPDYIDNYGYLDYDEMPEPRKRCYCDNCFSGCDDLAVELLRYMNIEEHKENKEASE